MAIKVDNVSKSFKLPHEKKGTVKNVFVSMFRGKTSYEKQQVLKNISFEVKKGEFFGIVGRNGSGKSTLLKLISGIYSSDEGQIQVNGKLVPFIELGVGFSPELTGRENVFLNGALLGFDRKQMSEMYDEIVEFAELEKFMDQKLKNYSSGMQVRLAFSIAIRANTDILVLDEVLAVGDEAFQRKCFEYFSKVKKDKKTVVLVTHDMNSVERFCNRGLLLKEGVISLIGGPQNIAASYLIENSEKIYRQKGTKKVIRKDKGITLTGIDIFKDTEKITNFRSKDKIRVVLKYKATVSKKVSFGVSLRKQDETLLAAIGTAVDIGMITVQPGEDGSIECELPAAQLRRDSYKVNASIWDEEKQLLDFIDSTMGSKVPIITITEDTLSRAGLFNIYGKWKFIDKTKDNKSTTKRILADE